jgi:hypothetical protein
MAWHGFRRPHGSKGNSLHNSHTAYYGDFNLVIIKYGKETNIQQLKKGRGSELGAECNQLYILRT